MTAEESVQRVLGEVEPWKREYARARILHALIERANERHDYPPGVLTAAELWALFTPFEQAVWRAVDDG